MKTGIVINIQDIVDFQKEITFYNNKVFKIGKKQVVSINNVVKNSDDNVVLIPILDEFYSKFNDGQLAIVFQKQGINNTPIKKLKRLEELKYCNKLKSYSNIDYILGLDLNPKIVQYLNENCGLRFQSIKSNNSVVDVAKLLGGANVIKGKKPSEVYRSKINTPTPTRRRNEIKKHLGDVMYEEATRGSSEVDPNSDNTPKDIPDPLHTFDWINHRELEEQFMKYKTTGVSSFANPTFKTYEYTFDSEKITFKIEKDKLDEF